MDKKSRQSLRERVVVHISDAGGDMTQQKILEFRTEVGVGDDESFIEALEGMVQDGLIRWDGSTYSLHSEGRKLTARVKKKAGVAVEEPEAEQDHGHDHDHGGGGHDHGHDHARPAAPPPPPPAPKGGHDHGHDHGGGGHDHGHDHARPEAPPPRPRPRPAPAASPPPPKAGMRAFLKGVVKRILGLDR